MQTLAMRGIKVQMGKDGKPCLSGPTGSIPPKLVRVLRYHREAVLKLVSEPKADPAMPAMIEAELGKSVVLPILLGGSPARWPFGATAWRLVGETDDYARDGKKAWRALRQAVRCDPVTSARSVQKEWLRGLCMERVRPGEGPDCSGKDSPRQEEIAEQWLVNVSGSG
jgi:hypothetical protein